MMKYLLISLFVIFWVIAEISQSQPPRGCTDEPCIVVTRNPCPGRYTGTLPAYCTTPPPTQTATPKAHLRPRWRWFWWYFQRWARED